MSNVKVIQKCQGVDTSMAKANPYSDCERHVHLGFCIQQK